MSQAINPTLTTAQSLSVSSRSYFQMFDDVPGAWFFSRRDGSFAFVNSGAASALGYDRDELSKLSIFDVDPKLQAVHWAHLWATPHMPECATIRTVHKKKDGTVFPVEIRASRVTLDGEEFAAAYAIDLTVSEQTRSELVETEARLQRLIAHVPDLVFRLRVGDPTVFEYLSPSALGLLGVDPPQIVGSSEAFQRLIHPEDTQSFLTIHTQPVGQGVKIRFVHSQGRWVWMDVRATVLTTTQGERVVEGVARDVSLAHEAELLNRRLRGAIEQATDAVVVTDAEGQIAYSNPAYAQLVESDVSELLGRSWLSIEGETDSAFAEAAPRVFAYGEAWQGQVRAAARHDGAGTVSEVTLSPIRGDRGEVIGCVSVKRDLSERVHLEDQLRQAQKMEAVGQLAGGMAHDFNNILHVIQGHAQLLAELTRGSPLMNMVQEISGAAERATRLIAQLLSFSRKAGFEVSVVRLDAVVGAVCEMLRPLLGEQVTLAWSNHAGDIRVRGSASQIEQVIANLCINARDAMPNGGLLDVVLLPLDAHEPLLPAGRSSHEFVELRVRDEGVGMCAQTQQRLFEPFFTTKERGKGTGLGLATAYAIVQAHGGVISLRSALGQGTEFRVLLPTTTELAPEAKVPPVAHVVRGEGRWVLLVEDDPGVRGLTAEYLKRLGFQVVTSGDGVEAEQIVAQLGRDYALLVVDAVMPRKGGRQLISDLRKAGVGTPVLLVTGYGPESSEGGDLEPVAVLEKPFSREQLMVAVGQLVRTLH